MLSDHLYPILEFDDRKDAKLNPAHFVSRPFEARRMIITFFPEVMDRLTAEGNILPERVIAGENPCPIYRFADRDVLITLGAVGCPSCAGNLDLFHAASTRSCSAGAAACSTGTSRSVSFCSWTAPSGTKAFPITTFRPPASPTPTRTSTQKSPPIWTTDAIFRETPDRIARRREEGAKIVEMEQAGCLAVAQFRGFDYGALIYGGDDVSQDEWSNRNWRSRKGIRYDLVTLCLRLVELL